MTNKGYVMSVDRHGINKSDRGPLAKCSFEETPEILAKAAIFGELDPLTGVSSNIMMGQEIIGGTGSIDLIFDEETYNERIEELRKIEEIEATEREIEELKEEYCSPENISFDMDLGSSSDEEEEYEIHMP